MPKQIFRIREGEPLLDIVSHGRGGPRETGRHFTQAQVGQIRRTVQRVPEAVVKVLPRDSNDLKAVGKHLDYIGRHGKLDLSKPTTVSAWAVGVDGRYWMIGTSISTTCGARQP